MSSSLHKQALYEGVIRAGCAIENQQAHSSTAAHCANKTESENILSQAKRRGARISQRDAKMRPREKCVSLKNKMSKEEERLPSAFI